MKRFTAVLGLFLWVTPVQAQEAENTAPAGADSSVGVPSLNVLREQWKPNETLQTLQSNPFLRALFEQGVELIPIGQEQGFDGWITTKDGQIQVFYTVPGKEAVMSGTLIGPQGENLTALQIARYEAVSGNSIMEKIDRAALERRLKETAGSVVLTRASQAEWLGYGEANKNLPFIYVFMNEGCTGCKDYFNTLLNQYVKTGLLEVRVVPVYATEADKHQNAKILAHPKPGEYFFLRMSEASHPDAIDVPALMLEAIENNRSILDSHGLGAALPVTLYRDGAGVVKIIQGIPRSINDMVLDVTVKN